MRKAAALAAGLLILLFVNFGIHQREQLVTEGRIVLLRLAPVDPRSLMQGDYMRLNFEAANQAFGWRAAPGLADGRIVVALDANRVGTFRRFADAKPLAPNEIALRYRVRNGQPNFATNAYFFQEKRAKAFEGARYGEFRVAPDGEMILTNLRGPRLERLK
jgi:uncharacterized membrane-anchored protein